MVCDTLEQWESLPERERELLIATWDIYGGKGYWVKLFEQAVGELQQKFQENPHVTRIFMANYHGHLEVCVATVRGTPSLPGFDNFKTSYRALPVRQVYA